MGVLIDLMGQKFYKLTVVEFMGRKNLHSWYRCRCDCGGEAITTSNNLRRGTTLSCGCEQRIRAGKSKFKHGQSGAKKTSEYNAWKGMKQRCYNINDKRYADWGGRGIKVCDRWLESFENFYTDMGKKPSPKHSLDRFPDTNGDYEPSNCRWGTDEQQRRNTRRSRHYEFDGIKMVLADWASHFGVNHSTLSEHLEKKTFEQVFMFYKNKNKTTEMSNNNETVEFTYVPRNGSDIVYGFFKNGFVKEKDGTIKEVPLSNLPETLKEELRKLIK